MKKNIKLKDSTGVVHNEGTVNQTININNQMPNKIYIFIFLASIIIVIFVTFYFFSKNNTNVKNSISSSIISSETIPYEKVKIFFSKGNQDWEKIISYGESKLEEDTQKALLKATLRAKANISKFLTNTIKTETSLKEISNGDISKEKIVNSISESSSSILRGAVFTGYVIDKDRNILRVKVEVTKGSINVSENIDQ